jgi:hypothetical protein
MLMATDLLREQTWYQQNNGQVTDLVPLIPGMVPLGLAKRKQAARCKSLISSLYLPIH